MRRGGAGMAAAAVAGVRGRRTRGLLQRWWPTRRWLLPRLVLLRQRAMVAGECVASAVVGVSGIAAGADEQVCGDGGADGKMVTVMKIYGGCWRR